MVAAGAPNLEGWPKPVWPNPHWPNLLEAGVCGTAWVPACTACVPVCTAWVPSPPLLVPPRPLRPPRADVADAGETAADPEGAEKPPCAGPEPEPNMDGAEVAGGNAATAAAGALPKTDVDEAAAGGDMSAETEAAGAGTLPNTEGSRGAEVDAGDPARCRQSVRCQTGVTQALPDKCQTCVRKEQPILCVVATVVLTDEFAKKRAWCMQLHTS